MEQIYFIAFVWLSLAILAAVVAYHFGISISLVEICLGVIVGAVAARFGKYELLGTDLEWLKFLGSAGAVLLTFLAGAELDPNVMKTKMKEVFSIGLVGFLAPFIGCSLITYYIVGWSFRTSLLCGVALSTTSVAVVYTVMLSRGLNKTEFGKGVLGACFVNDVITVLALSFIFSPFTYKTLVFVGATAATLFCLPFVTKWLTGVYAYHTAAIRTKWVLLVLFGLGALALWAGSEAVLPAYLAGIALADSAAKDSEWVRRLRTLTVGFLTPFYFLRAGMLISLSAILTAPLIFLAFLGGKVGSKIIGLYPVVKAFRRERKESWYYTLMMSTGLTFGTISALFGLNHHLLTQEQYSFVVAAVIASAVVPTVIAELAFLPKHLLPRGEGKPLDSAEAELGDEG